MFRKYYKAANDDIKPDRSLIDEIFKKAEISEKRYARVYSLGKRYGTAAAAVFVLAVSVLVYPQIKKMNEAPKIVPKTNLIQVENTDITEKKSENEIADIAEDSKEMQENLKEDKPVQQNVADEKNKNGAAEKFTSETAEHKYSVAEEYAADSNSQEETATEELDSASPMKAEHQGEQGFEIPDNTVVEQGAVSGGGSGSGGGGSSSGGGVGSRNRATTAANEAVVISTEEIKTANINDAERAIVFLLERFGKTDAETGNDFIFEITGTAQVDGESYFVGRWRWLTQNGNSSLLTEFVLNEAFTEMYEFVYGNDGRLQWNKENNLIE